METNELTVIITTFKSENKIYSCLNSISSKIKIIVIENSKNEKFKQKIESKYTNVQCFLTGDNKGYAVGNNLGLSKIETRYALVLNPDTLIEKNALEMFLNNAKKNPDFWLIGPITNQAKEHKINDDNLIEVNNLKGFAIFFNMEKFDNKFFDENYFLYFEEIDLCKKVKKNGGKIYLDPRIKINHEGGSSVDKIFEDELEKNRNWHWMWSTFYFHKKYNGFLFAMLVIFPKLISATFKTLFYTITLNKKIRDIYFCRLSGIINSIIGNKSWYRPTID